MMLITGGGVPAPAADDTYSDILFYWAADSDTAAKCSGGDCSGERVDNSVIATSSPAPHDGTGSLNTVQGYSRIEFDLINLQKAIFIKGVERL